MMSYFEKPSKVHFALRVKYEIFEYLTDVNQN
jgi:hypothetical protein